MEKIDLSDGVYAILPEGSMNEERTRYPKFFQTGPITDAVSSIEDMAALLAGIRKEIDNIRAMATAPVVDYDIESLKVHNKLHLPLFQYKPGHTINICVASAILTNQPYMRYNIPLGELLASHGHHIADITRTYVLYIEDIMQPCVFNVSGYAVRLQPGDAIPLYCSTFTTCWFSEYDMSIPCIVVFQLCGTLPSKDSRLISEKFMLASGIIYPRSKSDELL